MKKFKIKSGDTVKVIAGDHKGTEGKVLQIIKDKDRVLVEETATTRSGKVLKNEIAMVLKREGEE